MNGNRPNSVVAASAEESALERELAEILDDYMTALERDGIPPDLDHLAGEHPQFADEIRAYGGSLQLLHRAVSRLTPERSSSGEFSHVETRRLGDFEILRQIGRGGMGVVYEARQISLNRPVALKVLPFAAMLDERQIARFRTEAQAAAQLHHPHIVPVYAVGNERGVYFFAMQYIEGQSLDYALKELRVRGPDLRPTPVVDEEQAPGRRAEDETHPDRSFSTKISTNSRRYCRSVARLAVQAAEALHHAHEFGIVHRDIKPSNLLLDRNGKLWITDFGLARIQTASGVTVSGDVVGTLRYMSPEQAAGSNALVDARTDVYALGATLFELLTLRHAYDAENRQELLRQIESGNPPSIRKINPSIDGDLEAIVLCAMARSRDERYETARAMADDLQRYLAGEPTVARRPSLLDRAARWMLRHRRVAALAASLLVGFSLLCAISAALIVREKHRTDAALTIANESLARTEKHFQQARQVVDRFGVRLSTELAALPGSGPVRRELLVETLRYYRDFIKRSADDPQLRNELAATYFEAGSIAEQLGDRKAAQLDFEQALAVFRQLAAESPQEIRLQSDVARCLNNLGLLLAVQGEVESAEERYRQAIDVLLPFTTSKPERSRVLRSLAEVYSNLGLMYGQYGQLDQARQSLAMAIDQMKQLVALDSPEARDRHHLAICYNNLSYVNRDLDRAAAAEAVRLAIDILEELSGEDPNELAFRSDLALFHNNLGAIEGRDEQWQSACRAHDRAIELQRQLVRVAPHVVGYRQALAASLTNLGQAQNSGGDVEAAMQAFEESKQLAKRLVEDFPSDVQFRSLLGGVLNNLAMVQEQAGQLDAALESYADAIVHQRMAFDLAPRMTDIREFLSKHYYNYGRALRAAGKPAQAAEMALERRQLWPKHGRHLYEVAVELATAAEQLADRDGGDHNLVESVRVAREAKSTWNAAIAAGFNPTEANRSLGDFAVLAERGKDQVTEPTAARTEGL